MTRPLSASTPTLRWAAHIAGSERVIRIVNPVAHRFVVTVDDRPVANRPDLMSAVIYVTAEWCPDEASVVVLAAP